MKDVIRFVDMICYYKYKRKIMIVQTERNPEISDFYEHIAKLNFFKDFDQSKKEIRVNQQSDLHSHPKKQLIERVPLKFSSEIAYIRLWENLFMYEAKAQILRSKMEQSTQPQSVQFVEYSSMNKFKIFKFKKTTISNTSYMVGSLVVISPLKALKQQDYPHLLGFIEANQNISVRVVLDQNLKTIKQDDWKLLTTSKRWYIQNVCSLNTLQRQCKALKCFPKISPKIKEIILRPDIHARQMEKKFRVPEKVDKKLRSIYNESQFKAIIECLKQEGITLIQGPPGTGKTKTVLGTISVLLNSLRKDQRQQQVPLLMNWAKSEEERKSKKFSNPWEKNDWRDWRDQPILEDGLDQDIFGLDICLTKKYQKSTETDRKIIMIKKSQGAQIPGKIAICGPSNASVDQIIRKLIAQKLFDDNGLAFLPNFVRVGENFDPTLQQYSLQYIANKMAKKQKSQDIGMMRAKVLKDYKLVFGTLSSLGHQIVQNAGIQFDTVVIDEAGQSIEISNLIPLIYGCKRLILIGDPNQLPATIFSQKCLDQRYDQSLFQRMMKSQYPVLILKTQYRMTPQISQVIGDNFYGGQLNNDPNMMVPQPQIVPHSFVIFHIDRSSESSFKKSFRNIVQGRAVKTIAQALSKSYQDIGIISPYSQQVSYIQSLGLSKKCEVKTIDSFQGRQKNVIIFSAVRARYVHKQMIPNKRKTIGFVSDLRRINVSLSRAKSLCVIVCDIKRLASMNNSWNNIIQNAIKRGQVFQFDNRKDYFKDFKNNADKMRIKELDLQEQQA